MLPQPGKGHLNVDSERVWHKFPESFAVLVSTKMVWIIRDACAKYCSNL
jgi:hypothetical protein